MEIGPTLLRRAVSVRLSIVATAFPICFFSPLPPSPVFHLKVLFFAGKMPVLMTIPMAVSLTDSPSVFFFPPDSIRGAELLNNRIGMGRSRRLSFGEFFLFPFSLLAVFAWLPYATRTSAPWRLAARSFFRTFFSRVLRILVQLSVVEAESGSNMVRRRFFRAPALSRPLP